MIKKSVLWGLTILLVFYAAPQALSVALYHAPAENWYNADNSSSGLSPDGASIDEAVVQVFAARAFGWRGAFGVHTWIAAKYAGEENYTRYEVIGWGVRHGGDAVRVYEDASPDRRWFSSNPWILADLRGAAAEAAIDGIEQAVERYPYRDSYRVWPGPNSNTFTAYVAREVPELGLELPALAIGKDFLPNGSILAASPSGTGFQISIYGVLGVTLALEEGVELNLLGLTLGIDASPPALKLPGFGRIGFGA